MIAKKLENGQILSLPDECHIYKVRIKEDRMTADERQTILPVLRKAIERLGVPECTRCSEYEWVMYLCASIEQIDSILKIYLEHDGKYTNAELLNFCEFTQYSWSNPDCATTAAPEYREKVLRLQYEWKMLHTRWEHLRDTEFPPSESFEIP